MKIRMDLHKELAKYSVMNHAFAMDMISIFSDRSGFQPNQELGFILALIHLEQRASMPPGDFTISLLDHDLPMYLSGRPYSHTEKTLFEWLESKNPQQKQIAIMGFLEISKWTEMAEAEALRNYRPEPKSVITPTAAPITSEATGFHDTWSGSKSAQVVTTGSNAVHPILQPSRQEPYPYPLDPPSGIPFWVRFWGWVYMLLSRPVDKAAYWAVIETLVRTRSHRPEQISFTLYRWALLQNRETGKLGRFMQRLFRRTGRIL